MQSDVSSISTVETSTAVPAGNRRARRSMGGVIACYALFTLIVPLAALPLIYYLDQPLNVMPVILLLWGFVVCCYAIFCPFLKLRAPVIAASLFLLALSVSAWTVFCYQRELNSVHAWSDDYFYAIQATRVIQLVKYTDESWVERWRDFDLDWDIDWTLAAWPVLLGLLGSIVDANLDEVHAIAMLINAACYSVIFAVLANYFYGLRRRRADIIGLLPGYLLVSPLIVLNGGYNRKELLMLLAIALVFTGTLELLRRRSRLFWCPVVAVSMIVLLTSRPVNALVLPIILYTELWKKQKIMLTGKIIVGLAILYAVFYLQIFNEVQVRYSTIGELSGRLADDARIGQASGIGGAIFNIPLIGPTLYFIISPIPMNPFKEYTYYSLTLLLSVGSLFYTGLTGYIVWNLIKQPRLIFDNITTPLTVFLFFLSCAIWAAGETRYKLPTNLLLLITVYHVYLINCGEHAAKQLRKSLVQDKSSH